MGTWGAQALYDDKSIKPLFYHDKCDKYDYLISSACGAIAGLIDIFFVGSPMNSELLTWTDKQTDSAVRAFAKLCGWSPRAGRENSTASAIGFLEKTFHVNYDQRHSGDVGGLFDMSAKNHHMKSLAHSPDIVGLFFSVLNQFTNTASFLHNGQLITIQTETAELFGNSTIAKIFCGIANWFGHIMSDIAGSSGAVKRGSGVVIPFYELFQLCNFGSFDVGQYKNTLAVLATKAFQSGYDARFGAAMAIPVVICDLSIKLIWSLKHYFYHKCPINECIPTRRHDDLRLMLIIGNGVLCVMDGADAAIRSGGDWLNFFLRLNIIAWFRFITIVLREVCIRLGIDFTVGQQLDIYKQINKALDEYLLNLEQTDTEGFRQETQRYRHMVQLLESASSEEDLNKILREEYRLLGIELPYKGSFDGFMSDETAVLEFK